MGMLQEFKDFALKGNVVDMAVGVIMGGAFGKIINALVNDVMMPPLGAVTGKVNFADKYLNLTDTNYETLKAAKEASAPIVGYGSFMQEVIQFIIVAACMFIAIKLMNKLLKKEPPAPAKPPEPTPQEKLLTEIRDLLKARA